MLIDGLNAAVTGGLAAFFLSLIATPFFVYKHKKDVKSLLEKERLGLIDEAGLRRIEELRNLGKFPAKLEIRETEQVKASFRLERKVGEVIKIYKGYKIVRQSKGVSVGEHPLPNVIEAERWIDEKIKRTPKDIEIRPMRGSLVKAAETAETAKTAENIDIAPTKGALGSKNDNFHQFLKEALMMYKQGLLSEAAIIEIIVGREERERLAGSAKKTEIT
ncbi:hypothetical protein [Marivivens marinus]|uniref:hypothetical protein n=1 Tax=Marivivens marinus TaxID=3110173 RepID=UPI003B84A14B